MVNGLTDTRTAARRGNGEKRERGMIHDCLLGQWTDRYKDSCKIGIRGKERKRHDT